MVSSTVTAVTSEPKLAPNEYPAQSVADIATDMQQPLETMLNWLKAEPFPVMRYEDKWVVSGEGAIAAIAHFSKDIADRCLARRGLLKPATTESKTIKPDGKAIAPAATTVATKPAAKKKKPAVTKTTPAPAA